MLRSYSRAQIRQFFSQTGAATKDDIAKTVAMWLPEFTPHLPPPRKVWESEDRRMTMFDAVALALTFFHFDNKKRNPA